MKILNVQAGDRTSVEFSSKQVNTVLQLQAEANDVMSDEWRSSTNDSIPYYRASWIETAEALMHIGFKWWKNEHPTDESYAEAHGQAVMEVVDVMHFAASDMARRSRGAILGDTDVLSYYPELFRIGRFADRPVTQPIEYSELTFQDVCEQAIYAQLRDGKCFWVYICILAEMLDVTADHLFATYIGKNVLNKFRTSNGQREGTYHKIWNGKEDNVYLTQFLASEVARGNEITVESIDGYLDQAYKHYVAEGLTERA